MYAVFPDSEFTAESATGCLRRRRDIWRMLDDPHSSRAAALVSMIILAAVFLSTAAFLAETFESLSGAASIFGACSGGRQPRSDACVRQYPRQFRARHTLLHSARRRLAATIETSCAVIFTLELVGRLVCTPLPLHVFFRDPLNLVDVASVAPLFLELMVSNKATGAAAVLRVVRLVRSAYAANVRMNQHVCCDLSNTTAYHHCRHARSCAIDEDRAICYVDASIFANVRGIDAPVDDARLHHGHLRADAVDVGVLRGAWRLGH